MIQQTSLQAYFDLQEELGNKQATVFRVIKAIGRATNVEVAQSLNWPINCVTGRVFELRQMGLVRDSGVRKTMMTGKSAIAWEVVPYA